MEDSSYKRESMLNEPTHVVYSMERNDFKLSRYDELATFFGCNFFITNVDTSRAD